MLRNCSLRDLVMMLNGFRDGGIRAMIWAAALVVCCVSPLQASATLVLSPDGVTVYDSVNNISWLADANLPATNRFGLPVCTASGTQPCVNASGSMNYQAAAAWVQAMNAANYLGHTNWATPHQPARRRRLRVYGTPKQLVRVRLLGQRTGFAVLQCIGPEGAQYRRSHPQQDGRSIQQLSTLSLLVANDHYPDRHRLRHFFFQQWVPRQQYPT
jgi:hypothetical protein